MASPLRLVVVCAAVGCATASPRPGRPISAAPLPRLFGSVTWTSTPSELKRQFPGARIDENAWTCLDGARCVTRSVTASGWPAFGQATLSLSGPAASAATLIDLTAVDARRACALENAQRPPDCANAPGPALDALFDKMNQVLEEQLGEGTAVERYSSGEAHGYRRDPRERAVRWQRGGYTITLGLGADEFGWSVGVQAFRG